MHAAPANKTILCGAVIQGELKLDGTPIQVDTCALGAPARHLCYGDHLVQNAVYYKLPKDGAAPDGGAQVSMCTATASPDDFDSVLEILWCPSSAPDARFSTVGQCYNDDSDCGWLSKLFLYYPGIGMSTYGFIPVIKVSEYMGSAPTPNCATVTLVATLEA